MDCQRYDQPVSLQMPEKVRNETGELETVAWRHFSDEWAEVITLRGEKFIAAWQAGFRVDITVRIRWRPGISENMRIVWNGQPYAITGLMDAGARKPYIEMLCSSGIKEATDA